MLPDFNHLTNKKTLIIGELGSGREKFLANLVKQAISKGLEESLTIIDLAPELIMLNNLELGGKIHNYT
ncbi:hypothetical protein DRN86_02970, partial [Candidatus Geothermarchaeota archaeon]